MKAFISCIFPEPETVDVYKRQVQILWINLIMDTLAAMAFGGEPILDRYMKDQPAKRTDNILTPYIKSAIGVSAIFITLGSILILENIGGITSWVIPAGCADPVSYTHL